MAVRCEYCGQLYEGLSCPYCCAPRGEPKDDEFDDGCEYDGLEYGPMTPGEFNEIRKFDKTFDVSGDDYPDEWILTNSSCVGDNNVQVIGDNNVVNGWVYADNMLYYVDHDVWPEARPSERNETINMICSTCTHDAQVRSKVRELAEEQAKRHRISLRWAVINLICAWVGAFSLGVVIGTPVGFSVVVATVFCAAIGCCFVAGY